MAPDDMITAEEAWAIEARSMSEREFQAKVVEHAKANGWLGLSHVEFAQIQRSRLP